MADVLLVEVTGYADAGAPTVYRYSTAPYAATIDGVYRLYDDRLVSPGTVRRVIGGTDAEGQPTVSVDYGFVEVANLDGALDDVFASGQISFFERPIRILSVTSGADYSTARVLLTAVVAGVDVSNELVTIRIKDRLHELDSPHLTTTYAGNNALPAGVEGTSDIAGKVKPLALGTVYQIEPPCVNTSRLIYQVSTAAIQSGTVYDGGVALTAGTNYSSQTDMETTAPTPGQVRWWPAGGMFRLGSSPVYPVTVDVVADTAANSTAAQIIKRLVVARGWNDADVDADDVGRLDAANAAVCGLWIDDDRTTLECISEIARAVGAYVWVDNYGTLRMRRLDAPAGETSGSVRDTNCAAVGLASGADDKPASSVRIGYARYYRTLSTSDLAGSVSDAARSDFAQQWRVSEYTAALSPNPYKSTRVIRRDGALTTKTAADTEAVRLWRIYSVPRRTFVAERVHLDDLLDVDIGSEVDIVWRRFGFDAVGGVGPTMVVVGMLIDYRSRLVDLTLWG